MIYINDSSDRYEESEGVTGGVVGHVAHYALSEDEEEEKREKENEEEEKEEEEGCYAQENVVKSVGQLIT